MSHGSSQCLGRGSSKRPAIVHVQLYKNRKKWAVSSRRLQCGVITDFRNTYFTECRKRNAPPLSLCSFHQFHHRLHLIGHTAQHCGPSEGRLAIARRHRLGRGEQTDSSWGLAPPRSPLRLGPLVLGVEAVASSGGLLPLVRAPDQSIQHGRGWGVAQVLARDQRLPVLLLRDGEHRNAHVVALARKLAPLSALAALCLTLCGGSGGRPGLWRGRLGLRNPGGLGRVRRTREQAEAGPGEARAPQVADGVEAPLPLCRLRQGVGSVADGRVGDGAVLGPGLQVGVGEDLPAVCPPAISNQTGRSLRGCERQI